MTPKSPELLASCPPYTWASGVASFGVGVNEVPVLVQPSRGERYMEPHVLWVEPHEGISVVDLNVAGTSWRSGVVPTMLFRLALVDLAYMPVFSLIAFGHPLNVKLTRVPTRPLDEVHVLVGGVLLDDMRQPLRGCRER